MKSKRHIPFGHYCYRVVSVSKETFRFKVKRCRYYAHLTFNGVKVPWCFHMDKGGVPYCDHADHAKLLEHFGSYRAMDKTLPLDLLWDSCKECGVKEGI